MAMAMAMTIVSAISTRVTRRPLEVTDRQGASGVRATHARWGSLC